MGTIMRGFIIFFVPFPMTLKMYGACRQGYIWASNYKLVIYITIFGGSLQN